MDAIEEPASAAERQQLLLDRCRTNRLLGRRVVWLEETASTNDLCHAAMAEDIGLVVVADMQSAGRGQRGNRWHAPPHAGLLLSFAIDPPATLQNPCFLVAWTAVGVAGTVRRLFGIEARIKWPNDVLVAGKKLAGILVERRRWTVVGIGVNVNHGPGDFPPDLRESATSLSLESGGRFCRATLAVELLRQLDADYAAACGGWTGIFDRWGPLAIHQVGDSVQVVTRSATVAGRIAAIHPCDGVLLDAADGTRRHFTAPDVVRLEREHSAPSRRPHGPS